jgi:hypothetical protein
VAELLVLVAAALGLGAVGIAVGMLLAPSLTRWSERDPEEPDGER